MTPEELIKSIVLQFPAIGVLLYWSNRLYTDWQKERFERVARDERQVIALEQIRDSLSELEQRLDKLST